MDRLETLFPRAYWMIPGKILAGPYPGSREAVRMQMKLEALLDCGIRHFINLMEEDEKNRLGELFVPYEPMLRLLTGIMRVSAGYERIGVEDFGAPSVSTMRRILDRMDAVLQEGAPVYVHCRGGIGRTGTVAGCYLARHSLAEGEEALRTIAELRRRDTAIYAPPSPETPEQRRLVRSWRAGL